MKKNYLNLTGISGDIKLTQTKSKNTQARVRFLSDAINAGDKDILREVESLIDLPAYQDFNKIIQYTKKDLAEKFTKFEWFSIFGANNPGNIDFQPDFVKFQPEIYLIGLKDAEELENAFSNMEEVEWDVILPKLESLTRLECYVVQLITHRFWNKGGHSDFIEFYSNEFFKKG